MAKQTKNIEVVETVGHTDRAHARFSASGSAKWLSCPASITIEQSYPESSSVFAMEGTRAHELADICLKNSEDPFKWVGKELLGEIIGKDMAHYVEQYIEYIEDVKNMFVDPMVFYERKVDYSNLCPEGFGTLDSAIIDIDSRTCHIFDLKYGKGVKVVSENNTQAMMYASGLLNEMELFDSDMFDTFHIHICQPRLYHFDEWVISVADLVAWQANVHNAVELALSDNPPFNPTTKGCQWCKAKADCRALKDKIEAENIAMFESLDEPNLLTLEEQSKILSNKDMITAFLKAIEEKAISTLSSGGTFPGYKMIEGRTTTKWKDGAEENLKALYGDDKLYSKKFIGITDAKKLLEKEHVAEYTYKAPGAPKLVTESTKGTPITYVGDMFDVVED